MAAIQLGIGQSVGGLSSKPSRDILYEDFHVVVTVNFPKYVILMQQTCILSSKLDKMMGLLICC